MSEPEPRFIWTDDLSVGIQSIDQEHRLLVEVTDEILRAIGTPMERSVADRALRQLFAYTTYHFAHEEELMEAYGYPAFEAHRGQHVGFVDALRQLDERIAAGSGGVAELAVFTRQWLVTHIQGTDRKLGNYLIPRLDPRLTPLEFDVQGQRP